MRAAGISSYLRQTLQVEGWFFPVDAHLFGLVDEAQKRAAITGDLFEIGVHHGRTALLLLRMRQEGEHLGVCDVFGRQDLNLDRSGEGSRDLFVANVRRFEPSGEGDLRIFAKRSAALTVDETGTRCRLFHIDGGHLPADVLSDLAVAERSLLPLGVIVVDDVFNSNWPGVAEGFFRFMTDCRGLLAPLLIGGNKVYLCRPEAASLYESAWSDGALLQEISRRVPYTFERKEWLGRKVTTAIRHQWVDLDPMAAAKEHVRGGDEG